MPGSFQGIETSSRALRAFQRQIDTTGHNIANVNTPGYSRQTVDLASTDPNRMTLGRVFSVGSGVTIGSINRIKDQLIEARRQTVYGDQGRFESNLNHLEKVQRTFLDAEGKGITTSLDFFYNSWSALGSNPSSSAARQQAQMAGQDLTRNIRGAYQTLEAQIAGQNLQIGQTIQDIQALANKIGELNSNIRKDVAAGGSPNDLMDQRDETIAELSKLVNVKTHSAPDGTLSVFVGSLTLVDQVGARPFPTDFNAEDLTVSKDGMTWPISSGKLRGLMENVNQLTGTLGDLDQFANELRSQVNLMHQSGIAADGSTGNRFFNDSATAPGAKFIDLDAAVLASASKISAGTTGASGDGSLALSLSGLRDAKFSALGNQTIGGFFGDLITSIGSQVASAKNKVSTAYSMSEQVEQQMQEVSGVNIDDEMANMLRFQRSYQAAAKVLNIMDQTVGELIDMLRR